MDSVGEGEGGKIWENGIETCILSCMKWVTSPGSMHDTGCLGLVHWDDPEGRYGEGGGFRMGNTWIPVADSFRYLAKPIQYCKVKKKKKRSNILWFPVESGQCQCSLTSSLRQSCSVYSKRSHSLKVSIQIWSLKLRTTNEIFWGKPRYHWIHLFFSSEWLYQGEGF